MRQLAMIFGVLTLLAGAVSAWIMWTSLTQADILAPALAAAAATAAAITIIPYCMMRVFIAFRGDARLPANRD